MRRFIFTVAWFGVVLLGTPVWAQMEAERSPLDVEHYSVEVEIEPRRVNLAYDATAVDIEQIKAAIEEVGYEVPDQE